MAENVILTKVEGKVATLTLNRPDKRNAINGEMLEAIQKAFDQWTMDPEVHTIVLRGQGKCFAAGIDLGYLAGLAALDPNQLGRQVRFMARNIQTVMNTIENIEKPVVAAIHGFCGGLALEMAMACDFRIATQSAEFGVPEIFFGLLPDCGGTTRLTRSIGIARAKELVMLGEMVDGATADKFGLVNRLFPDESFEEGVDGFLEQLLQRPLNALGLSKRLIDIGAGTDRMTFMDMEAALQSILITSPDFTQTFSEGMGKISAMKKARKGK